MKEIIYKVDHGIAAREMSDMLMDDTIPTYDMFEDLVVAYENGNEDFRKGMDKTLTILLWKNMAEICEYMKENACYGEED